jgi:hypothetical protein
MLTWVRENVSGPSVYCSDRDMDYIRMPIKLLSYSAAFVNAISAFYDFTAADANFDREILTAALLYLIDCHYGETAAVFRIASPSVSSGV